MRAILAYAIDREPAKGKRFVQLFIEQVRGSGGFRPGSPECPGEETILAGLGSGGGANAGGDTQQMRIETNEFGIDVGPEALAWLRAALFDALREHVPHIDLVNVTLRRRTKVSPTGVTCVMAAHLLPSGRAVVLVRAGAAREAIDHAIPALRAEVEGSRRSSALASR